MYSECNIADILHLTCTFSAYNNTKPAAACDCRQVLDTLSTTGPSDCGAWMQHPGLDVFVFVEILSANFQNPSIYKELPRSDVAQHLYGTSEIQSSDVG